MTGEQPLPSALVRGIRQLEPMPVTAQRLLALLTGEEVSLATIAELVEFDQAIAAAVLRMARSWTYAGARPPETVRDAVLRLVMSRCLNASVESIVCLPGRPASPSSRPSSSCSASTTRPSAPRSPSSGSSRMT
jgi:hypothetical protein